MESVVQQQPSEKIIVVLAFTLAISVMSATMFNIVLPEIMVEFHLSLSQVSWVTSAYLLIFAVGTVIYGKLADTYKLKNLLTFGLAVFALGSIIGLSAHHYWVVLLGRIFQAVGSAVIPATAAIIPVRYFPQESRGRALGIVMTGGAIGTALGPAIAALVVSLVHWRFLFFMPLLILLTVPYYRKYLTDAPQGKGKMDWLGCGLLAGSAALLLLAITNTSWIQALGCLILLVLFTVRIHSIPEPFIKPNLFKSKRYSLGLTIAFLATGIGYSLPFLSPQLLTHVNHLAPGLVGLVMVPAAVLTAILGRIGGKLADVKGNAFLFYMASTMFFTCFVLLSSFAGTSPIIIAIFLTFGNVGQAFIFIALTNGISRTLPKEESGVGMGLLSMLNFISGAVFATIYSTMVNQGANSNWNPANVYPDAFIYSNIYLVLAILIVSISLLYYFQFSKAIRKTSIFDRR